MSEFEQINLTEGADDYGNGTFDVTKVAAMGLDNEKILDLLRNTLQPLGKAMQHVIHEGTGVAVVDMGGKMEIIAIRRASTPAPSKVE